MHAPDGQEYQALVDTTFCDDNTMITRSVDELARDWTFYSYRPSNPVELSYSEDRLLHLTAIFKDKNRSIYICTQDSIKNNHAPSPMMFILSPKVKDDTNCFEQESKCLIAAKDKILSAIDRGIASFGSFENFYMAAQKIETSHDISSSDDYLNHVKYFVYNSNLKSVKFFS